MSLFGNLPPIESKDGAGSAEAETQDCGEPAKQNTATATAAAAAAARVRPEFAPNLRRHRATKPVVRRPLAGFDDAEKQRYGDDDGSEGQRAAVGDISTSVVRPPVPLLNPKHPHSLPRRPELLMSKWEAIVAAGGAKQSLDSASGTGGKSAALPHSLAEYMPIASRLRAKHAGKRVCEAAFDPFAEYCPAAPNDYQVYKDWVAREKQLRSERQSLGNDDYEEEEEEEEEEYEEENVRRDPGEPSTCIVLSNMADVVDDGLELETREECAAFGTVVRCTISTGEDESVSSFEQIRVLVEFADLESAIRAQEALDQRFFDRRHISAEFVHMPSSPSVD